MDRLGEDRWSLIKEKTPISYKPYGIFQEISNRTHWTDPEKTWVSNSSSNLLRGPLVRSHLILDGHMEDGSKSANHMDQKHSEFDMDFILDLIWLNAELVFISILIWTVHRPQASLNKLANDLGWKTLQLRDSIIQVWDLNAVRISSFSQEQPMKLGNGKLPNPGWRFFFSDHLCT